MATSWQWLSVYPKCCLCYLTYLNTIYRYLCNSSSSNGLLYLLVVSVEWTKMLLGHSPEQQLGHHYEVYIRVKMTYSVFTIILEKYKALWLTLNWVYTYTHHTISTHWTTEQLLQNHPNLLNHILLCCNITLCRPKQLLWLLSYSWVKNITITHPTLGRVPGSQGLPGHLWDLLASSHIWCFWIKKVQGYWNIKVYITP